MEKHIVNSTSLFEVDNNFQDQRFMKVRVTAMHSGINRNGSRFERKVIEKAKNTFANIPILAEVQEYTDENGEKHLDYTTHAMHVEEDAFNEGEARIIYDEAVVGIVPETNNFEIIHDDETGNDYVLVDALIFRDYGNYACDILEERGGRTDVSAEIACDDVSFSAKDKCLDVGKMQMCAITLLGEDVKPGMAKAHAEVFASNNDNIQSQLIQIMQELKESLDNYTKFKEGGNQTMTKFEELLEQYNKTVEEIEFEYEGLTDEELEAAFAEAFSSNGEDDGDTAEPEAPASVELNDAEPEATEDENNTNDENNDEDPGTDEFCIKCSVSKNGETKEFSVSLSDKLYAMNCLINETYSDLDCDYYDVNVYEDEKIVEMYGWCSGKAFRQSYKTKKDSYQLVGDRVEIFARYLTQDEINSLDNMRSNYSEVTAKLQKYEDEPKKVEILESAKYGYVADTKEFEDLKNNHFDLAIEEVTAKADDILLSYAEQGALKFTSNEGNNEETSIVGNKTFIPTKKTAVSRYGNVFSR